MNFHVNEKDIDAYARMVERAHDGMAEAKSFLDRKAVVDTSPPSEIWQLIVDNHSDVVQKARSSITAFEGVLESCYQELDRVEDYYLNTEREQAAKLDGTYPKGHGREAGTPQETGGFTDAGDPTSAFSEPQLSVWEKIQQGAQERMDGLIWDRVDSVTGEGANPVLGLLGIGLDLVSPSTLVNEGLKFIFNFDLFGEVAKWFAGDWESYDECSQAWASLSTFFNDVALNIRKGNNLLSDTWVGNASSVRYDYFDGLFEKLGETDECYSTLERAYEEVARVIQQFADGVKAGIILISDIAISIAVEAAVAAGAASTGVGLVVTGGLAALIARQAAKAIAAWSDIINALSALYAALNMAFGLAKGALDGNLDAVQSFPRPGAAYDHPAV